MIDQATLLRLETFGRSRPLEPRIVLRRQMPDGEWLDAGPPVVNGRIPVSPEALAILRDALTAVVQEQRGTGGRARVPGVLVAGKTGTAQVVRLKHTEDLEDDGSIFAGRLCHRRDGNKE